MIEAINENSVVETETLFRVGGHSLEVKTAAIDFIAKNMKTLLADIKDPFSGFAKDKNCHDMMVEVMRTWGSRTLRHTGMFPAVAQNIKCWS